MKDIYNKMAFVYLWRRIGYLTGELLIYTEKN